MRFAKRSWRRPTTTASAWSCSQGRASGRSRLAPTSPNRRPSSSVRTTTGRGWAPFIDAIDAIRDCPKPTIARLNGMVVGGGNELNLACDLAVAAEDIGIRQIGPSRGLAAVRRRHAMAADHDRRPSGARDAVPQPARSAPRRHSSGASSTAASPAISSTWRSTTSRTSCSRSCRRRIRATKAQVHFWKDLSWGLTIRQAREWLTIHAASAEVRGGLESFREKRLPDYEALRESAASAGGRVARLAGEPAARFCPGCGTAVEPDCRFCPSCGVGARGGGRGRRRGMSDDDVVLTDFPARPRRRPHLDHVALVTLNRPSSAQRAQYRRHVGAGRDAREAGRRPGLSGDRHPRRRGACVRGRRRHQGDGRRDARHPFS